MRFSHIAFISIIFPFLLIGCSEPETLNLGDACNFSGKELYDADNVENAYFPTHRFNKWTYTDSVWSETTLAFEKASEATMLVTDLEGLNGLVEVHFNEESPISLSRILSNQATTYSVLFGSHPKAKNCRRITPLFFNVSSVNCFKNADSSETHCVYRDTLPQYTEAGIFNGSIVNSRNNGLTKIAFQPRIGIVEERNYKIGNDGSLLLIRKVSLKSYELF